MLTREALRRAFPEGNVGDPALLSAGTDGSTFLLDKGPERFVLRRWARKPFAEVLHEASLLQHLSSQGFPCPPPFSSVFVDADGMTNAVRPFVKGSVPLGLSPVEVREIGRMLGRLHELTRSVSLEGSIDRYQLDNNGFLVDLESSQPALATGLKRLRDQLASMSWQKLQTSVVHDDVSPENIVRSDDGSLVLIDWSESHFDFSVADIGSAVAQLRLDASGIRALLEGYREVACLSAYEALFVDLIALRRVLFLVWYYSGLTSRNPNPIHERLLGELLARAQAGLQGLDKELARSPPC